MIRSHRFALLTGVALPFVLAGSVSGTAAAAYEATPFVVAQAGGVAAAQAEVAAAQAALQEAQANGGDVATAQARLDAALNALAAAQTAQSQPEPQPEPPAEPQSEPPAEPQAPPQTAPAEPPAQPQGTPAPQPQPQSQEAVPQPETPPAAEAVTEPPPSEPPAAESAPELPAAEPAPSQPPAPEQPAPQTQNETAPAQETQAQPPTPPAAADSAPRPPAAEAPQSPMPPAASQAPVPELPAPDQPPSTPSAGEAAPPPELPAPPAQAQPEAPTAEQQPAQAEAQPEIQAPPEESAVESQLEAQGDNEAVENVRSLRDKLRQEFARGEPDGDAEQARRGDQRGDERGGGNREEDRRGGDDRDSRRGDDRDYGDRDRRHRDRPPADDGDVVLDFGLGFVVELGDQLVIRRDSASEQERFLDRARDVDVEHFRGGYTRTVVTRRDGTRIYTVRNRYGDIITRTRVSPNGRQVVLIDNRDFYRDGRRPRYGRYDRDLPPLRVDIPRNQYVVETSRYGRDDIRAALMAPPVEAVEHPYSLEDVRTNQRLRDKLRRVDLNTITFDFGSAAISPSQFEALAEVGTAMEDILARSPDELFLLEGYTDAIGSPTANLILSDQRAEAIAVALSSNFAIPPENLITQGYGEQYLKVPTQEAERENRRVTVRRITPLVAQAGVTAR